MPPPEFKHSVIASLIVAFLWNFVREHKAGRAGVEVGYKLPAEQNTWHEMDAAYCSYERFPKNQPIQFVLQAPEICIEVVSSGNTKQEINRKIADYLKGGAQQVWIIYPSARQIYVYTADSTFHIYQNDDVLDGGRTLPGFKLPLAELWEQIF
jgi:Uma2 family endonuclease